MIYSGSFDKIGFTNEEKNQLSKLEDVYGESVEGYVEQYFKGGGEFQSTVEKMTEEIKGDIGQYTLNLLFVLHGTGFLYEKYKEAHRDEELFFNILKDIRCKTNECLQYHGVLGLMRAHWYMRFFDMSRFAVGRLQFDLDTFKYPELEIDGFKILPEDKALGCHIPSMGPLTQEMVVDSLKSAYNLFPEMLKDGILVVRCLSWLLYPKYLPVFGEQSNTAKFARDFYIFDITEYESFTNSWRIFGIDYKDNLSALPAKTSMQRAFIEYFKDDKGHGVGAGVILFDGEKILTAH